MKYKISDAYLNVNGEDIAVGVVLGEEDKPESPFRTGYVRASEYEKGLKGFKYGKQKIGDMVYHQVGKFVDFKAVRHVDEKWIEELKLMGYDTSKLINRMGIKEFAKSISGKEYGYPQFTKEEIETAIENGFVIVYGASDDLMEFEGTIQDEGGCFDGGKVYFNKNEVCQDETDRSGLDNYCNCINAVWCGGEKDADGQEIAWTYETEIPHETFMIYEDGEPYCRGIVFCTKDIGD